LTSIWSLSIYKVCPLTAFWPITYPETITEGLGEITSNLWELSTFTPLLALFLSTLWPGEAHLPPVSSFCPDLSWLEKAYLGDFYLGEVHFRFPTTTWETDPAYTLWWESYSIGLKGFKWIWLILPTLTTEPLMSWQEASKIAPILSAILSDYLRYLIKFSWWANW
jgi:hypothetical protein